MRRSYADRSEYLADPDFYSVPLSKLLDRRYLAGRRSTINRTEHPEAKTSAQDRRPATRAWRPLISPWWIETGMQWP